MYIWAFHLPVSQIFYKDEKIKLVLFGALRNFLQTRSET